MLIEQLSNQFKEKGKIFEKGRIFLVEQNQTQHCDFLTISWILSQLEKERKVVFIAFRQNYAHYLSLSKKLGKSIQPYLKSKLLKYYECFQNVLCQSEFPLTQTSPNSYISPPTTVTKIKLADLNKKQSLFEENSTVIVDAISFIEQNQQVIFRIYEEAMEKNCKIIMAGIMEGSSLASVFLQQADLYIKLENDVGNHGKMRLNTQSQEISLHWKFLQGKFDLTQYIKL